MLYPARPPLSTATRLLGFAGLVPQLGAVLLIATGIDPALGALLAFLYAATILSFIGGIWWGFAVGRTGGQPVLAAAAVVPTLVAVALGMARLFGMSAGWGLVAIGCALLLSLLVDRRLTADGRAPPDWMALRVPLSVGLGAMTIFAGAIAPGAITLTYAVM